MFMVAVSAYAKWGTNGSGMLGMVHRHGIKLLILFVIIAVYIGNCAMIDSTAATAGSTAATADKDGK